MQEEHIAPVRLEGSFWAGVSPVEDGHVDVRKGRS